MVEGVGWKDVILVQRRTTSYGIRACYYDITGYGLAVLGYPCQGKTRRSMLMHVNDLMPCTEYLGV